MGLFDRKKKSLATTDNISPALSKDKQQTQSVNASNAASSTSKKDSIAFVPYKRRKSMIKRKQEVEAIRQQFPNKIPVIVECHKKEKNLPQLDKPKFLVPQELTMSQFATIIRERMQISYNQTFYLLIGGRAMALMSLTLAEVYNDYRDDDGFLYMSYASQEAFG